MRSLRPWRGGFAVWALNAVLVAAALALYDHVDALQAPDSDVHLPRWALAIAFALTEVAVVHVHFRRGAHTLTLAELPLALGLLFAEPGDIRVATANSGSGVSADELVRNADVAMYVSKHGGKGRLSHFEPAAAAG